MSKKTLFALALAAAIAPLTLLAGGGAPGGGGPGGGGPGGGGFGGGAGGPGGGGFGGGGGGPGGGGFGGGGGGFGAVTADTIKAQVNFTDDEWKVVQPKLQKVLDTRAPLQPARGGRGGGGFGGGAGGPGGPGGAGGPGGPGGPGGAAGGPGGAPGGRGPGAGGPGGAPAAPAANPVAAAQTDLTTLLADAAGKDDAIKTKLAALRDAKKKARTAYDDAQADLKKVLTVRQEAMLVSMNILD